MPSNKRKNEFTDVLAGGSVKKMKNPLKDPFEGRFGEVVVEVYDIAVPDFANRLYQPTEDGDAPKFEIKSYRSECMGVAKTVCGETRFIEELKGCFVLIYEVAKKDELIKILTERFPSCAYTFK